ncbi:hypothetical protein [Heyndrickxia acidicola]|uniref:Uncharacterized protein n=1 Tax=Heyndrickxia acidicola TaxID=209389 RepID=A0ABU6MQU2_9BACI|nr:hypothetical protein [Heyndrickxia acidicola]MED1205592.1 hypothetical protein [Heyndrickxia acidicola]
MAEQRQLEHDEISDLKVMKSANGYYLGREQYDKHLENWFPYNRVSSYIKDYDKAEKLLNQARSYTKNFNDLKPHQLKEMSKNFDSRTAFLPQDELKKNLIDDHINHDREFQKKMQPTITPDLSR